MPGRVVPLVTGEFYHIFNRGSEKRDIFLRARDYRRFLQTIYYYQFSGLKPKFSHFAKSDLILLKPIFVNKYVEILCYCLMPNHFHLLVHQLTDNGISVFLSQISNSYTKYFNIKYYRVGPLLQGAFKAVLIESEEQLLHVSRYIHINSVVSQLAPSVDQYPWSSCKEYINSINHICSKEKILSFFPSPKDYKQFLEDQIDYGSTLEQIKHQLLDIDD